MKKKKNSLSIVLTTWAFLPCRPLKTVVKQEKMGQDIRKLILIYFQPENDFRF